MATIAGRPFLEFLLLQLKRSGFSRVILGVGYQSQVIQDHFGEKVYGMDLIYSTELSPLGTGGALRQAVNLIKTDNILVMNGDSYTDLDLRRLVVEHTKEHADLTVVIFPDERSDAGSVLVDTENRITAFAEKRAVQRAQLQSAGIYLISKRLAASIPAGVQISLEERLFPMWIEDGRVIKAFFHPGKCIDIGTPERYQSAQGILREIELHGRSKGSERHS
jgi:D-glycero-alpha-D-manno-heptose 1-phosphate guanylyltransferase